MRYDQPNQVTGSKTFHDLEADVLQLDRKIKVQDVDIIDFATKAVLKNRDHLIVGKPVIQSASFEEGLR